MCNGNGLKYNENGKVIYVGFFKDNKYNGKGIQYLENNDIIYVEPTIKRFVVIDNLPAAISTIISALTLFYLIQQPN